MYVRTILKLAPLVLAMSLFACGADDGIGLTDGGFDGGGDESIGVAVVPSAITVPTSGETRLVANVSGTAATGVIWSVQESGGGTVVNDGASAAYRAPTTEGVFHVKATAVADATKTGTATITVSNSSNAAIQILPEPVSANANIPIRPSASQTFTAVYYMSGVSLSALIPVPEVQWSIVQGSTGGSITTDGNYTAPSAAGTFHVLASVPSAPTKSAIAEIQVASTAGATLVVTPGVARISTGATAQFSGQVTGGSGTIVWSVLRSGKGTVSSTGLYTAPLAPGVYVVRARVGGGVPDALGTVVVQ